MKRFGVPHLAGDPGDDLPIRQRLPDRIQCLLKERQVAFGIDHHSVGLCPQRSRQQNIGVFVGLGAQESILGDDEVGLLQGRR